MICSLMYCCNRCAFTDFDFEMAKNSFKTLISQKHKTFPADLNMYGMKCKSQLLEDQENVTLTFCLYSGQLLLMVATWDVIFSDRSSKSSIFVCNKLY